MIDLNRMSSFVYNCSREFSASLKKALINVSVDSDSDDLFIVGESVAKGPGEGTSLFANVKLPCHKGLTSQMKDSFKVLGTTDCDCEKLIFIISDDFSDNFCYQLCKMLKLSENNYYNIKCYIFQIGHKKHGHPAILQEQDNFENLEYFIFTDMDSFAKKITEIYKDHNLDEVCDIENEESNEV